jgi:hypothetical protein
MSKSVWGGQSCPPPLLLLLCPASSWHYFHYHPVHNEQISINVIPSEGRRSEATKHESRDLVFPRATLAHIANARIDLCN